MPIDTLLAASVELLVLGMGTVFVILGLLIGCMTILGRLAPKEEPVTASVHGANSGASVVAAIQSAIHMYRSSHAAR